MVDTDAFSLKWKKNEDSISLFTRQQTNKLWMSDDDLKISLFHLNHAYNRKKS